MASFPQLHCLWLSSVSFEDGEGGMRRAPSLALAVAATDHRQRYNHVPKIPKGETSMTTYRADQVGSFLRPKDLLAAREDPNVSPEQLRQLEDKYVLECLEKQKELGFKIFSDGELRRATFMSDFNESVNGIGEGDAVQRQWSGQAVANLGVAVGKISIKRRMTKHETDFMKAHSPGD